jgi:8-oxo-dGTP pyrophosphatase MutT (NUDIX family)
VSEQRLSCGIVLARHADTGWMTLLLRAFHHWDFPKGIREAGEEPMQAAIREVAEETGITELSFDWGDRFFETGPYSRGKVARYFIAVTSEEDRLMRRTTWGLRACVRSCSGHARLLALRPPGFCPSRRENRQCSQ